VTGVKFKLVLPYAGMPVIAAALLILRFAEVEPFILLKYELLILFGYMAALSDLKAKRIPNRLIIAMIAAWVLMMTPMLFISTDATIVYMKDSLIGLSIGGGLFLLVYVISRKGLGGGDVKFMAAAGLYLGLGGVIPVMLYGTILAALSGLILILLKKIGRKDTIPLAPFLYAGVLLTVFLQ